MAADRYPVIITTTQKHLAWVDADDQQDAVDDVRYDPEWYRHLTTANQIEGAADYAIDAPTDESDWTFDIYTRPHGPIQACTTCEGVAREVGWPVWHKDGCPAKPAPARKQVAA